MCNIILAFSFFILAFAHAEVFIVMSINYLGLNQTVQVNGGINGSNGMDRQSWIDCFNSGKCLEFALTNFLVYPVAGPNGQLLAGCYAKRGGILVRTGDYQVVGGGMSATLECPPAQNAQIRVFTFGRQVCPPGAGPICTIGGRLEMGCLINNLNPLGPENPFSFTSVPCFNGGLVVRDSLNLQTSIVSVPSPSTCPAPGETLAVQNFEFTDPSAGGIADGNISVAKLGAPCSAAQPCDWSVSTSSGPSGPWGVILPTDASIAPMSLTGSSTSMVTLSQIHISGFFRVGISYENASGETCTDQAVVLMKSKCAKGYQAGGPLGCVKCVEEFYKDHIGNMACTPCPKINTNSPPANADVPSGGPLGKIDVIQCKYDDYNLSL